ncbi:cytochrome c oxidase assembly protein [Alteribacillus sp. JSM 102045]|uniref:cytochrome c oxidase assembly protein n=1 Tax=Alteribacillus sp. JSM 102045 TaxID=1562101 RepID=UPI0035BF5D8A
MSHDFILAGQWTWNTSLLTGLICIAIVYALLVKHFTNIKIYYKQPLLFFFGLGLLYFIMGSPLSSLSHQSFSTHMAQMSIFYFIVPPFLLLGIPNLLFQKIWETPIAIKIGKLLLPPIIALSAFAVLFLMYHLPFVLKVLFQHPLFHSGYTLVLLVLSFRMWWPMIAAPDSSKPIYKEQKKRYAFLSGLILMPACLLFVVNGFVGGMNTPFFSSFTTNLPHHSSSSPFNTRFDHFAGGILMLGIHKFGLMLTFHIGNKVPDYNSHTMPKKEFKDDDVEEKGG